MGATAVSVAVETNQHGDTEVASLEKTPNEPCDLLADFRVERETANTTGDLLTFDDDARTKQEPLNATVAMSDEGGQKEDTRPMEPGIKTLDSNRKVEDQNETLEVLKPGTDSLESENVIGNQVLVKREEEDSEDSEGFVEAHETLDHEDEKAGVAVHTPVQDGVTSVSQTGSESVALGPAVHHPLHHTTNIETVSTNQNVALDQDAVLDAATSQDAVLTNQVAVLDVAADQDTALNVLTNQDAVLDASTNQDAVLDASTNQDAALDTSTNQDAVLDIATNQDAVLDVAINQDAVLDVATNQDAVLDVAINQDAVLDVATNQETADVLPSAPALLGPSEMVQLVCREEVEGVREVERVSEGPLYPRLDSVIEGAYLDSTPWPSICMSFHLLHLPWYTIHLTHNIFTSTEQEVLEKLTPFSEQELAALYPNPQLDANPLFVDLFIQVGTYHSLSSFSFFPPSLLSPPLSPSCFFSPSCFPFPPTSCPSFAPPYSLHLTPSPPTCLFTTLIFAIL